MAVKSSAKEKFELRSKRAHTLLNSLGIITHHYSKMSSKALESISGIPLGNVATPIDFACHGKPVRC